MVTPYTKLIGNSCLVRTGIEESVFLGDLKENSRKQLCKLELLMLPGKLKSIVTLLKRLGLLDHLTATLKQTVETRWNSTLILFLSFPLNFERERNLDFKLKM